MSCDLRILALVHFVRSILVMASCVVHVLVYGQVSVVRQEAGEAQRSLRLLRQVFEFEIELRMGQLRCGLRRAYRSVIIGDCASLS